MKMGFSEQTLRPRRGLGCGTPSAGATRPAKRKARTSASPPGCTELAEGAVWSLDYRPGLAADELSVTDEPLAPARAGEPRARPAELGAQEGVQEARAGGGRRGSNGA